MAATPTSETSPEREASAFQAAFEALYRSSRDDLYAYVAGILRDRSAAEDITALAFERAYRKASRFDPTKGSQRAWLFGIARNAALDELRKRQRSAELTAEPVDEAAPSPPDEASLALRRATVREAIAGLDPTERELVTLKFFAGLSNREVAAVVGVSESNAGTKLHRVIEKLRRACNEEA